MRRSPLSRSAFPLAVTAFIVYAGLFIYRTSFIVGGERYFSLFDDAMVSMRYARNLADGYGLVWNPGGERVEGFTNPLWVLFMALVHLLPIPPSKTSLVIQITAAILMAVNLFFVRRIALAVSSGSAAVALGAVGLTAVYLPINNWSLQGMEVGPLVLVMSVCSWLAIHGIDTGTFKPGLYVTLGIGALVRPDMVVPLAVFLCFLAIADPAHRRAHVKWGLLVLGGTVAVQTAFRVWYYGDVLPNTSLPEDDGRARDGATHSRRLRAAAVRLAGESLVVSAPARARLPSRPTPLAAVLRGSGPGRLQRVRRGRRVGVLGGSNRYISIAMPGFFVLLSYSLYLGDVRPRAGGKRGTLLGGRREGEAGRVRGLADVRRSRPEQPPRDRGSR